jgi:hypothetical protein
MSDIASSFDWALCERHFRADGSLRDIYVLNTTLREWSIVLALLSSPPFCGTLTADGEPVAVPSDASELFVEPRSSTYLLSLDVGRVHLACHLFEEERIEFDFVPNGSAHWRYVTSSASWRRSAGARGKPSFSRGRLRRRDRGIARVVRRGER